MLASLSSDKCAFHHAAVVGDGIAAAEIVCDKNVVRLPASVMGATTGISFGGFGSGPTFFLSLIHISRRTAMSASLAATSTPPHRM